MLPGVQTEKGAGHETAKNHRARAVGPGSGVHPRGGLREWPVIRNQHSPRGRRRAVKCPPAYQDGASG